ncbi:MAG: helix-turn-helix domain-containing protein [Eggerthellaceae bacterium]|nr:helix-turn-helix domain-containing protein [Eggerthellaceae bacterium]
MDCVTFSRDIGRKVRERRLQKSLTQKQLAEAAGVSERLIRSLEIGESQGISLEKLLNILQEVELCLELVESPSNRETSPYENYSRLLQSAVASWSDGSASKGRDW